MKAATNTIRRKFIECIQRWYQSRLQVVDNLAVFTGRERAIYDLAFKAGFKDGVGVMIAATDSREDNGANYRIVDLKGDYISFYDPEHPDGGTTPEDFDKRLGLIVSIFPER